MGIKKEEIYYKAGDLTLKFKTGNTGYHDYWGTEMDGIDYVIIQHRKNAPCDIIAHYKGAGRAISFRPYQDSHPWIDISSDENQEVENPNYWMKKLTEWLAQGNKAF